jgi:hypothetical protein
MWFSKTHKSLQVALVVACLFSAISGAYASTGKAKKGNWLMVKLGLVPKDQAPAPLSVDYFRPDTDPAKRPVETERYNKNDEYVWQSKHQFELDHPHLRRITYSIPISE